MSAARVPQFKSALLALALACASSLSIEVLARDSGRSAPGLANEVPKALEGIDIEEHLGEKVDLSLRFRDETGALVPLSKYVNGSKPVILDLAYYSCPSLCNFHLNGMTEVFKKMPWTTGDEFDMVIVSIDAREKPELALSKKASYISSYGRPEGAAGWHFLTGDEAQIQALAKQVGFKYRWDEKEQQFAHASAAEVLTPDGRISRYLYGIVFDPKTVRLSLVEAGQGKIGGIVDRLILWCFHYDPVSSKYSLYATNIMRGGGVVAVFLMAAFFLPFWMGHRSKPDSEPESKPSSSAQGEV